MPSNTVTVRITGDASGLERETKIAVGHTESFGRKAGAVFAGLQLDRVATAAAGWAQGALKGASDLGETVSKSNAIFGGQAQAIEKWAGQAHTSLGISKQDALGAASNFGN